MLDGNTAALADEEAKQDDAEAEQAVLNKETSERQTDAEHQIDALATISEDYMHLIRDAVCGNADQRDDARADLQKMIDKHIADEVESSRADILVDVADQANIDADERRQEQRDGI